MLDQLRPILVTAIIMYGFYRITLAIIKSVEAYNESNR